MEKILKLCICKNFFGNFFRNIYPNKVWLKFVYIKNKGYICDNKITI